MVAEHKPPAPESGKWGVRMGYNKTQAVVVLWPACPHGGTAAEPIYFPLADLCRLIPVLPAHLQAIWPDVASRPAAWKGVLDFDNIRLAAFPESLTGWTMLDLGGYEGEFAALALRLGALQATVVDNAEWRDYGWPEPTIRPKVRYEAGSVFDWHEPADLVVCYNVLYHVRDPIGLLEHLRRLTRRKMALCTSVIWSDEPVWRLYSPTDPGESIVNGRYTVYFKPSLSALQRGLERVGFTNVETVGISGDHVVMTAEPGLTT